MSDTQDNAGTEITGELEAAIAESVDFALTGAKTFSTLKDNFKEREIYTTTREAWEGYFSTAVHPTVGNLLFSIADDDFKASLLANINPAPQDHAPAKRGAAGTHAEIDTGADVTLVEDGGPSGHDGLDDGTGEGGIKIIHNGGEPIPLAAALATSESAPSNSPFGEPDGQGAGSDDNEDPQNDPQGPEDVVIDPAPTQAPAGAPVTAKSHGPRNTIKPGKIKPGKGGSQGKVTV